MQEMVKRIGTGKPVVPQLKSQPTPITPNPRSTVQIKQPTNQPKQPTMRNVAPVTSKPSMPALLSHPKNGAHPRSVPSNEKTVSLAAKPASPAATTPQMNMLKTTPALHKTYGQFNSYGPRVKAKAMMCVDCSSNKIMLADNASEPLPIASITKLLTAMVVIDEMDLDKILEVPSDITEVEQHKIGIRPGDTFTARDLLHGMLIASGNDCAEVLARAYARGGRLGFMSRMKSKAAEIGASRIGLYTPSGLDAKMALGKKDGRTLEARKPNTASAEDVAAIARKAFAYPLISSIAQMRTYTMRTRNPVPRDYNVANNDRLLHKNLPIAGAKTGFTNKAGKCIVALFKDQQKEHVIVVLNSPQHFKAAEKIYRWACKAL
ncbi:MAG: serine hydrolase [Desulfomonilaceae bacterium]